MELMAVSAPIFPWLLAGWKWLTDGSMLALQVFLGVLGALRSPLLYWLSRRLSVERLPAFLACLLFQAVPSVVYYDVLPMKVGLEMTLLTLLLLVLTTPLSTGRSRLLFRSAVIGVLLAFTFLLQLNTFLYVVPITAYVVLNRGGWKKVLLQAAPMVLLPAVAVAAFQLRADSDRYVPRAGVDFYVGNNPGATGTYRSPAGIRSYPIGHLTDARVRVEAQLGKRVSYKDSDAHFRNLAIHWLLEQPAAAAKLTAKNSRTFSTTAKPLTFSTCAGCKLTRARHAFRSASASWSCSRCAVALASGARAADHFWPCWSAWCWRCSPPTSLPTSAPGIACPLWCR